MGETVMRHDPMDDPLQYLGSQVQVEVDRPLGSRHPTHDFGYPVNYGFVPGTVSGDGESIDAYVLGPTFPVETYTGVCIAVILREEESDPKLVVVPPGDSLTNDEILEAVGFQEQYFRSRIVRHRAAR